MPSDGWRRFYDDLPDAIATCSSAKCEDLGWSADVVGVDDSVCGGTIDGSGQGGPSGCSGSVSFDAALDICQDAGARLCTLEEVQNGEAAGSGCNYDAELVWTQTRCDESGTFKVVLGDGSR